MNEDYEQQHYAKISTHERLATIEASQRFLQRSIEDITNSLKELAKTQHMLVVQKEEQSKIIATLADMQKASTIASETNVQQNFQLQAMNQKLMDVETRLAETEEIAQKNKTHLNMAIKAGTAILVPVLIAMIKQVFGLSFL